MFTSLDFPNREAFSFSFVRACVILLWLGLQIDFVSVPSRPVVPFSLYQSVSSECHEEWFRVVENVSQTLGELFPISKPCVADQFF